VDERQLSSMSMGRGVSPFAALERATLFEGLDRAEITSIALKMRPRSFAGEEELCRAGEEGDRLFVIVDGLVQVLAGDGTAEPRVVAKQRRGDVVGGMALVTGEPHPVTVVAAMPTETLELEKAAFEELLERHPALLRNMNRILTRRLARSYAHAGVPDTERGEAVGLIVGPGVVESVPDFIEAARGASARPVGALDTREGFDSAMAQLDDLLAECAAVIVVARAEGRSAPLLVEHVDRVVIVTDRRADAERFAEFAGASLGRELIEVVLIGDAAGGMNGAPVGRSAAGSIGPLPVIRVIARDLPPAELAWLGRHLAGTKLGLALGAGGAKGYAHVGVLAELEQAGYVVDCVSGSSIGAVVGTHLALGKDAAEIDRTLREMFTPEVVAEVFKLSLSGQSPGLQLMTRIFRETTGERTFADTSIPLAIMSVDLTDRCPAPIREGPLWDALLAATALAGMFPPHERDGHRLVDGLALVPVPTGAAVEDGADVTVSVNLMGREVLPAWPGLPPPPPPPERHGSRMLETLLEVMDLMQLETGIRHAQAANVPITPVFGPGSWKDFHLADLFMEAGRRAARERLPALRALARPQFETIGT
jgi:NTE family protein